METCGPFAQIVDKASVTFLAEALGIAFSETPKAALST